MEKIKKSPGKTPAKLGIDKKLEKLTAKLTLEEKKELITIIDTIYSERKIYVPQGGKFSTIENIVLEVLSGKNDKEKEKLSLFSFFLVFDILSTVERFKIKSFMDDLTHKRVHDTPETILKEKIFALLPSLECNKYIIDVFTDENYKEIGKKIFFKTHKESQNLSQEDIRQLQTFETTDGKMLSKKSQEILKQLISPKKSK